ncbi:MAG TPA: cupin domain-containing protein [Longimicrobium sp.]|nr:cupin domain-containing protein [Longimicrobium sp.]
MHPSHVLHAARLCAALLLAGCSPLRSGGAAASVSADTVVHGEGLILGAEEGERRVRRPRPGGTAGLTAPFILKVDERNGGSPDLVMGYEDIPPGERIQPHQHLHADEIIFVHRGSGVATLGGREGAISAGSTVYIPRNTRVSLRNTGSEPLGIAFIFSKPGFEQLMRENSVPEGQPATPVSAEEFARIRARHRWHTVYDQP